MKYLLLILATACTAGCNAGVVDLEKVRIVHVEREHDNNAHFFVMQQPYTVVEDSKTKERWLVPGVFGDVDDEFVLGHISGQIRSQ